MCDASLAGQKRPLLSDVLAIGPSFPQSTESGCITAQSMKRLPSPSETPRLALIRRIAELPPNSHKRQALIGQLQAIVSAIFSAGPYGEIESLTELEQIRIGLIQRGEYTSSAGKAIEVRRRAIKQARGVRM